MAKSGFGIVITFASGFCAEIQQVNHSGMHRDSIDSSHMTTEEGWDTFFPSDCKDPGELGVDLSFKEDQEPPIDQDPETITVTFKSGRTIACTGFMTDFEYTAPRKERMTASATLKFSGKPTWA